MFRGRNNYDFDFSIRDEYTAVMEVGLYEVRIKD